MNTIWLVTTCVVVWIEIKSYRPAGHYCNVTTCVVVWIEIDYIIPMAFGIKVTTCVVVWIEICQTWLQSLPGWRHHLRGGVD